MMVMMMKEKLTYQVLNNITKKLDARVPHEDSYNFNIKVCSPISQLEFTFSRQIIKRVELKSGASVRPK